MIVIGLMSGTSADGIEAVAAEVDPAAAHARLLATHHSTVRTITDSLRREAPGDVSWSELAVAGGGAANSAIMDALREAVSPVQVRPMDKLGVPAAAREALAFAILGAYRLAGLPNTLPRCTGASRAVSAGAVHAP